MADNFQSITNLLGDLRSIDYLTITLLGLIALGFFVAWNLDPWRSLVGWLVTFSLQFSAGSFHLSVSDLFLVPLAIGTFVTWAGTKKRTKVPGSLLLFAFLFLTLGNLVTALRLGELPQWTWLNKDIGLVTLLVPYWSMLVLCPTRDRTEQLIRTFVTAISVVNLVGLTLYVISILRGVESIVNYGGVRFRGFLLDPNGYAGLVGAAVILQFAVLSLKPKTGMKKLWDVMNCCTLGAGCLLTLSRGGLVALLAGGMALMCFIRVRSSYAVVVAIAALAFAVFWFSSSTGLEASIQRRADDRGNVDSRIEYMEQGLRMYTSAPLTLMTGIGIGTFFEESPKFLSENHQLHNQIHNTFVWLLVEGGPLIFLAYLFLLYRCLAQTYRVYRDVPELRYAAAGCFSALILIIVWCMGVEGTYHHHVWVFLALSEILWYQRRNPLATTARVPRSAVPSLNGAYAVVL